jgi:hypothetical protein
MRSIVDRLRRVAFSVTRRTAVEAANRIVASSAGRAGLGAAGRALAESGGRRALTFVEIGAGDLQASIRLARQGVRVIAVDPFHQPPTSAVRELEVLGGSFVRGQAADVEAGVADHVFQYFPWQISGSGSYEGGGTWRLIQDTLRLLRPNGVAHFVTEDFDTALDLVRQASQRRLRTVLTETTAGAAAPGATGTGVPGFSASTPVWQVNIYAAP